MAELLLELLSEEIPARMQARAADDLKRLVCDGLKKAGLEFDSAEAYVTPRRLALVVDGLPVKIKQIEKPKTGPKLDAPEKAKIGFATANSIPESSFSSVASLQQNDSPLRFGINLNDKDEETLQELEVEVDAASSNFIGIKKIFVEETPKGPKLASISEFEERSTVGIIRRSVFDAIFDLNWPKSMKWGENRFLWVRRLQNILVVFNKLPIEGVLTLGRGEPAPTHGGFRSHFSMVTDDKDDEFYENYIKFTNQTTGHRFLSPKWFTVKNFKEYKAKLKERYVILDAAERRAIIETKAKEKAKRQKLTVKDDPALLDEVTGLVEWPVVYMGYIDDEYMVLPDEVLTTSMRVHQKYFSCLNSKGTIAQHFIFVADSQQKDKGKTVRAGNERVLSARLADAKFFWDQDRKQTLESRIESLDDRIFHTKLGTDLERARRISSLAKYLTDFTKGDPEEASRAGRLCKADLTTGMVGEFPELEGTMGSHYAQNDGEVPSVYRAIAEHYSPRGPNDTCPSSPISVAVSLADKIDTLVGFFATDEKPTGSKDPFALRRAAIAVIRLIIENKIRLPLTQAFDKAFEIFLRSADRVTIPYSSDGFDKKEHKYEFGKIESKYRKLKYDYILFGKSNEFTNPGGGKDLLEEDFISKFNRHDQVCAELLDFFAGRLKVHLKEKGIKHDMISAVIAVRQSEQDIIGDVDLIRVLKRVDALKDFLGSEDGKNLLIAYRRVANIVLKESKKDKKSYLEPVEEDLLSASEEKKLFTKLSYISNQATLLMDDELYVEAMSVLSELREPIDAFFDKVTVNCDEKKLRMNRLKLLAFIQWTMDQLADFSKIEGGER